MTRLLQDSLSIGQGFSNDSRTTCQTELSTNAMNGVTYRVNYVATELTRKKGDKMRATAHDHRRKNRVVLLQFSRQLFSSIQVIEIPPICN